ncbi:MAG: rhomboid family intramembrane serine protease [Bacteroidales bacterium]|nr:rhomboid family intramembrane serine protease [Bacteroidales bacterium]MBN2756142.1 rhomboid family intramembrane serine protease [Bacteroidales bacterium]
MDVINEIKKQFKSGNIIMQLIIINVAVFVIINIFALIFFLFNIGGANGFVLIDWLAVPASLKILMYRPWTLISYMFTHQGFMHILFNMLWLFWFGKIFLEFLDRKKLLSVYLLGGISGAVLYILAYNIFPAFEPWIEASNAIGASASVYAIVVAISAYAPNYEINLLLIGRIKIKYIALFVLAIDLLSIPQGNAGGHISHLGGALFGYLFAVQLKNKRDISAGFSSFIESIAAMFSSKPKMTVKSNKYTKKSASSDIKEKGASDIEFNKRKATEQEIIDKILEKISKSGYESLSKSEKETLFKASKK